MIQGNVNARLEAAIALVVTGPDGDSAVVETVIDTGFSDHLALSPRLVRRLKLLFRELTEYVMADNTIVMMNVYRGTVMWDGVPKGVLVLEADGEAMVGMALLSGYRMTMDVKDGGQVSIEALSG